MAIGETDVIQVSHPQPNRATSVDDGEPESEDAEVLPRIHLGPIGGGRAVIRDQTLRQDFATHYGCLAFDYEFDPGITGKISEKILRFLTMSLLLRLLPS